MRAPAFTSGFVLLLTACLGACAAKQREFSNSSPEPSGPQSSTAAFSPAAEADGGSSDASPDTHSRPTPATTEPLTASSETAPAESGAGVTFEPTSTHSAGPSSAELSSGDPSNTDHSSTDELDADSLRDELVLHLTMDDVEWTSGGIVNDSSAAGNHGTIHGTVQGAAGRFGKAASFDGNGWITVPDADSLDVSSALTMSAWVNFGAVGDGFSPGIVSKRTSFSESTAYTLFLWSENKIWVDIDYENERFASTTAFTTHRWYHVAVVYDGALDTAERVRVYVDGVLDTVNAEASERIPAYDSDLEIGRLVGGGDAMRGMIDEVAIWRRALGPREVALLAGSPLP